MCVCVCVPFWVSCLWVAVYHMVSGEDCPGLLLLTLHHCLIVGLTFDAPGLPSPMPLNIVQICPPSPMRQTLCSYYASSLAIVDFPLVVLIDGSF